MKLVIEIDGALYEWLHYQIGVEEPWNTVQMAIIDGEPPKEEKTNGDCISRAKAVDCLSCSFDITGRANMEVVVNYINSAYDKIMNLPNVQPEPKTGHWKRISIDKYTESAKYWYVCDKCGEKHLGNTNYCPNCGAKMVEPQESEETETN